MPQYRLSVAKAYEKTLVAAATVMGLRFVEFDSHEDRSWLLVETEWPLALYYQSALREATGQTIDLSSPTPGAITPENTPAGAAAIVINGTPLTLMQAVVLVSVIESRAKQYREAMRAPAKLPDPGVVDIMRYLLPVCKLMGIELD